MGEAQSARGGTARPHVAGVFDNEQENATAGVEGRA